MDAVSLYIDDKLSTPQISEKMGVSIYRVRKILKAAGVIRSRQESIKIAADAGRLGSGLRGKTRVFSDEWRNNISAARCKHAEIKAAGVSLKPSGYIEITRGQNKGRSQHVVVAETIIGRRLYANESVHHIDGNKSNNDPSNLLVMTRSEHARLHALENHPTRKRKSNGQFE